MRRVVCLVDFFVFLGSEMDYNKFSCGGFFIFDPSEQFVLLGETPHGYLSPQKGGVEEKLDQSLFDCACRETKEESGINPIELMFLPEVFVEHAPSGRANIAYWIAKLKVMKKNEFTFDASELISVRWYHIDTLLALQSPKLKLNRQHILRDMQKQLSNVQDVQWLTIDEFEAANKCTFHTAVTPVAPSAPVKIVPPKNVYENEGRLIVQLLRHQLADFKADAEGYVKVGDLLDEIKIQVRAMNAKKSKRYKPLTFDIVRTIVDYDNRYSKKRLDLKKNDNDEWVIAANQGHSGAMVIQLQEILEPLPHVIHGTEQRFRESIERIGLQKMTRTHIHCIACDPDKLLTTQIISGFKKQSDLIVVVDMKKTMHNGLKWFIAKNNVLLTEGPIPPQYLSFRNILKTKLESEC